MARLLYIESSPRKDRSTSIAVAREFLAAYAKAKPADRVETLDLWATTLPEFTGEAIDAKYRILHGQAHTPAEAAAWSAVVGVFNRFAAADKYLLSAPMWNFGIPYRLKHFIDIVTQPGLSFAWSEEAGYQGLVKGKPIVVALARGGSYEGDAAAYDLQKPTIEGWLRFIGFTDIRFVLAEPTLDAPEAVARAKAAAIEQARKLAAAF